MSMPVRPMRTASHRGVKDPRRISWSDIGSDLVSLPKPSKTVAKRIGKVRTTTEGITLHACKYSWLGGRLRNDDKQICNPAQTYSNARSKRQRIVTFSCSGPCAPLSAVFGGFTAFIRSILASGKISPMDSDANSVSFPFKRFRKHHIGMVRHRTGTSVAQICPEAATTGMPNAGCG
jgi:hypothetical protein